MSKKNTEQAQPQPYKKRIVISQGGKGGIGKTGIMRELISWYHDKGISPFLLDFDFENRSRAGLNHWFKNAAKYDLHKRDSLDEFFNAIEHESDVVLADQGAGAGEKTQKWFSDYASEIEALGLRFTLLCPVTEHPSTVTSVLTWAQKIGPAVDYLIALNEMDNENAYEDGFKYWRESPDVKKFEEAFKPQTIVVRSRPTDLEGLLADNGVTLAAVAKGETDVPELKKLLWKIKAQGHYRKLTDEFDRVAALLLP